MSALVGMINVLTGNCYVICMLGHSAVLGFSTFVIVVCGLWLPHSTFMIPKTPALHGTMCVHPQDKNWQIMKPLCQCYSNSN